MSYQLTHGELVQVLREQIAFLERSAEAFDSGYLDEAKRLAVVIRVLVHDTDASRSLLGLLGVKDTFGYLDTASPIHPENLVSTPGLVGFRGDMSYVALLGYVRPGETIPKKRFDAWWSDAVTKADGRLYSRRDYVLRMSNKEGGAHVDPNLDERWAALTRHNALGWLRVVDDEEPEPMGSPAPPSVRQIAYELDSTLREQIPELLG